MQKSIHVQVRVSNYKGCEMPVDHYLEINEAIRKFINCKAITGGIVAVWEKTPDFSGRHNGELTSHVLWETEDVKPRKYKEFIQKLNDVKNALNAERPSYEKTYKKEEE